MNRAGVRFNKALQLAAASAVLALAQLEAAANDAVTLLEASELSTALEAREGKVVLVNFWATWCRPCLDEIPDLQELEAEFGEQGFELLAVSLDDPWSAEDTVAPFLAKWFPTFSTYLSVENDMDTMVSVIDPAWNEVLPTSYVMGRDGEVAARIQGGSSAEEFAAVVEPQL